MAEAADTPTRTCVQCDNPLIGKQRRFCSRQCIERDRALERNQARRQAAADKRDPVTCLECRTTFKPSTVQNTAYCSPACKSAHYRSLHPEKSRQWSATRQAKLVTIKVYDYPRAPASCRDCGSNIAARSHVCGPCAELREAKRCRDCEIVIARHQQRCEPCAAIAKRKVWASPGAVAARRKAKAHRAALQRGVSSEPFDPFEVLERDGWRCHMCGCKTPKRLRGTYDDRAPELDHVVPLAAGGEHSRRNTACACRKCNSAKGAKPLGQLRLIG